MHAWPSVRWLSVCQTRPSLLVRQGPLHDAPALCVAVPQPIPQPQPLTLTLTGGFPCFSTTLLPTITHQLTVALFCTESRDASSTALACTCPLGGRQPQAPACKLWGCKLTAPPGVHAAVPEPLAKPEPEPEPLAVSFPGECPAHPAALPAAAWGWGWQCRGGRRACLVCWLGWPLVWVPGPVLMCEPETHCLCAAVPQPQPLALTGEFPCSSTTLLPTSTRRPAHRSFMCRRVSRALVTAVCMHMPLGDGQPQACQLALGGAC